MLAAGSSSLEQALLCCWASPAALKRAGNSHCHGDGVLNTLSACTLSSLRFNGQRRCQDFGMLEWYEQGTRGFGKQTRFWPLRQRREQLSGEAPAACRLRRHRVVPGALGSPSPFPCCCFPLHYKKGPRRRPREGTHLSPRETSYPRGHQADRTAAGAGGTGLGTPALCPLGLAGHDARGASSFWLQKDARTSTSFPGIFTPG